MFTIKQYVRDFDTNEVLPFATVFVSDANGRPMTINGNPIIARKSDANGHIIIPIAIESAYITFSYIGYQSLCHPASWYINSDLILKKKINHIKEVIVKPEEIKRIASTLKIPVKKEMQSLFFGISVVVVSILMCWIISKF
jgi:hypothetical protein